MDKLKKTLEKMDSDTIKQLQEVIGVGKSASKTSILNALVKISGLNSMLSSLDARELEIFTFISSLKTGRTFSEIEKATQFNITEIESICDSLKDKLLIYIFKNRKHLNNRFDKVYLFEPVYELINHYGEKELSNQLQNSKKRMTKSSSSVKIRDKKDILQTIYNTGGIITLNALIEKTNISKYDTLLADFEEKGYISIHLKLTYPFSTIILLSPEVIDYFIDIENTEDNTPSIKNGYSLLVNTLYISDIIRSNGLYLTQQNHFRKTDIKKLQQVAVELQQSDGTVYDVEKSTQLSLYLLYLLDTLELTKTNVFFSIDPISKILHLPHKMLELILKKLTASLEDENFNAPLEIPKKSDIDFFITQLQEKSRSNNILFTQFLLRTVQATIDSIDNIDATVMSLRNSYNRTLEFLILCGIIDKKGNTIELSDTLEPPLANEPKTVYINPDFSLMIPKLETSAYAQYILLSFSAVIKNDVILNAKITKESVLHAYKRGLKTESVISILEKVSANSLPQNMSFLINEWIKQTLKISINYGILLEINHASFLDELEYKHKGSIIRKVSDTCAIVKKDNIDDIVRLGEKHKAIIHFENIT
ncbi:MAG: helicase-associated domain-containing protein [Spirochaetes bacterium]|jgi:hypothetical protein|nr:helicase-associated domain-containing protein [Spirochaetota bacterium]